jgi:hypothetical protein
MPDCQWDVHLAEGSPLGESTGRQPGTAGFSPRPLEDRLASAWAAKGRARAAPLLALAGDVADPAPVEHRRVDDTGQWPFGRFMVAWLDASAAPRLVRHLPDEAFFLRLLTTAYQPVLSQRPDLAGLLRDDSRFEVSITNDVLQIQLRGLEDGYSMIRHHALMLFSATLWLDEPRRAQWLELYDGLLGYVSERPGGRPGPDELARVEASAFADFLALRADSLDEAGAGALLADPALTANVTGYLLYAGAAIALLWRQYRQLAPGERARWQRAQLAELYRRPDYLRQEWMTP